MRRKSVIATYVSLIEIGPDRSKTTYNLYKSYVDTNICRTSVLGKPVSTGKTLAVGKPSTGRKTYVNLEDNYM